MNMCQNVAPGFLEVWLYLHTWITSVLCSLHSSQELIVFFHLAQLRSRKKKRIPDLNWLNTKIDVGQTSILGCRYMFPSINPVIVSCHIDRQGIGKHKDTRAKRHWPQCLRNGGRHGETAASHTMGFDLSSFEHHQAREQRKLGMHCHRQKCENGL